MSRPVSMVPFVPATRMQDAEALARAARRIEEAAARLDPKLELQPQVRTDGWLELSVRRESLLEVARMLRDRLGYDYLLLLTGVDWEDKGFQVVLHVQNLSSGERLVVTVNIPRDDPRCPSVTSIWPTANWHEREAWDLLGIRFEGHPDLRRILMKEGWIGHPLRKDYQDTRPPRERLPRPVR